MVKFTGARPSEREVTHAATTPPAAAITDAISRQTDNTPIKGRVRSRLKIDIAFPGVRICLGTCDSFMIWAIMVILVAVFISGILYR